jgi:hypothetical protein
MKCKNCKKQFMPVRPLQNVCSLGCAIELSNKKGKTDWKLRKKVMKEKSKTQSDYIQELQKIFNSYIRERDKEELCICCNSNISYKDSWDAGHYIPTTKSYLRFNEFNVNKQKRSCNYFQRGNQPNYRIGLIKKYGLEVVEHLELDQNKELILSISDIKEKITYYKNKLKALKDESK